MTDIVTFGETMIRLSPPDRMRLEQSVSLNISAGGAELNVAAGAARLGLTTAYVSRLPSSPLGRLVADKAREFGVDVRHMLWADGERMGLYFVEYGAEPRPTRVYYDRKDSALARIQPGTVDWSDVFRDARLFHVGGITPALSASAYAVQKEAMIAARAARCLVSYDINYRAALWSVEEARRTQLPLMEYVDILITSLPDQAEVSELISGLVADDPGEVAQVVARQFGFKAVLMTRRKSVSAQRASVTSVAWAGGRIYSDRVYEVETVDPLGGGDACVAGFLTGYLEGDIQAGVRLGNAFSALQQTSPTDLPWPTRAEVETLIAGGASAMYR